MNSRKNNELDFGNNSPFKINELLFNLIYVSDLELFLKFKQVSKATQEYVNDIIKLECKKLKISDIQINDINSYPIEFKTLALKEIFKLNNALPEVLIFVNTLMIKEYTQENFGHLFVDLMDLFQNPFRTYIFNKNDAYTYILYKLGVINKDFALKICEKRLSREIFEGYVFGYFSENDINNILEPMLLSNERNTSYNCAQNLAIIMSSENGKDALKRKLIDLAAVLPRGYCYRTGLELFLSDDGYQCVLKASLKIGAEGFNRQDIPYILSENFIEAMNKNCFDYQEVYKYLRISNGDYKNRWQDIISFLTPTGIRSLQLGFLKLIDIFDCGKKLHFSSNKTMKFVENGFLNHEQAIELCRKRKHEVFSDKFFMWFSNGQIAADDLKGFKTFDKLISSNVESYLELGLFDLRDVFRFSGNYFDGLEVLLSDQFIEYLKSGYFTIKEENKGLRNYVCSWDLALRIIDPKSSNGIKYFLNGVVDLKLSISHSWWHREVFEHDISDLLKLDNVGLTTPSKDTEDIEKLIEFFDSENVFYENTSPHLPTPIKDLIILVNKGYFGKNILKELKNYNYISDTLTRYQSEFYLKLLEETHFNLFHFMHNRAYLRHALYDPLEFVYKLIKLGFLNNENEDSIINPLYIADIKKEEVKHYYILFDLLFNSNTLKATRLGMLDIKDLLVGWRQGRTKINYEKLQKLFAKQGLQLLTRIKNPDFNLYELLKCDLEFLLGKHQEKILLCINSNRMRAKELYDASNVYCLENYATFEEFRWKSVFAFTAHSENKKIKILDRKINPRKYDGLFCGTFQDAKLTIDYVLSSYDKFYWRELLNHIMYKKVPFQFKNKLQSYIDNKNLDLLSQTESLCYKFHNSSRKHWSIFQAVYKRNNGRGISFSGDQAKTIILKEVKEEIALKTSVKSIQEYINNFVNNDHRFKILCTGQSLTTRALNHFWHFKSTSSERSFYKIADRAMNIAKEKERSSYGSFAKQY